MSIDNLKIELHMYHRNVREVHDYGNYVEVREFVRELVSDFPHTVNVKEVDELSKIEVTIGNYSDVIEIVVPKDKLKLLKELIEPLKRMLCFESETDIIDATAVLYDVFFPKMLTVEENYADVKLEIENSESEGFKATVSIYETYG